MSYNENFGKGSISGLKIIEPEVGVINVGSFRMSPGRIMFQEEGSTQATTTQWNYDREYINSNNFTITLNTTTSNYPKMISVFSTSSNRIKNSIEGYLNFDLVEGDSAETLALPDDSDTNTNIFLGVLIVPSRFPATNTQIYYRSVANSLNSYNLINSQTDWVNTVKSKLEYWDESQIYFDEQVVRYDNKLYISQQIHASSSSFANDLSDGMWVLISGSGGSSVDDEDYTLQIVQNSNGNKYLCIFEKISFHSDLIASTGDNVIDERLVASYGITTEGPADKIYSSF